MIRFIVAIDDKNGLADDHGIPWPKPPSDLRLFRDSTKHTIVMMGYKTYQEFDHPLSDRRNLVATHTAGPLQAGFEAVNDVRKFLQRSTEDIWVIGGAGLFATTLDLADELLITYIKGDYNCTKFFPDYKDIFELAAKTETQTEKGVEFYFTTWKRKSLPKQR
nr:Dihydrofolate reductase [uncultured bacterium]